MKNLLSFNLETTEVVIKKVEIYLIPEEQVILKFNNHCNHRDLKFINNFICDIISNGVYEYSDFIIQINSDYHYVYSDSDTLYLESYFSGKIK